MKNNFNELFKKKIGKFKSRGYFNIKDMARDIYFEFQFNGKTRKRDQLEWLKMQYIVKRLESELSEQDCYSYKKNEFISLDEATLANLQHMEGNFETDIAGRESTLKRIKEKIAECNKHKGQMELQFEGSKIVGIDEVKTIEELLPGSDDL